MAGTITLQHFELDHVRKIVATCVADAANGSFPDTTLPRIEGRILAIETNPGSPAPTDNYDVTVEDQNAVDVLLGVGANRHTTTSQRATVVHTSTSVHPCVAKSDALTLKIAGNSVNSAQAEVTIYYAPGA